jgi:hypothetical protein
VSLLVLLAALPAVYWAQPVDTAPAVRQAGLERLCVPEEGAAAWRAAGFAVVLCLTKTRSASSS